MPLELPGEKSMHSNGFTFKFIKKNWNFNSLAMAFTCMSSTWNCLVLFQDDTILPSSRVALKLMTRLLLVTLGILVLFIANIK